MPRRWRACAKDPEAVRRAVDFAVVEGVEPTNTSPREICGPQSSGAKEVSAQHSEGGSRFVERMMTVVVSLRLQQRNVFDYLVQASERTSSPSSSVPAADRRIRFLSPRRPQREARGRRGFHHRGPERLQQSNYAYPVNTCGGVAYTSATFSCSTCAECGHYTQIVGETTTKGGLWRGHSVRWLFPQVWVCDYLRREI